MDSLKPISDPRCRICGRSLISEKAICTQCRQRTYHFSDHRSLFEYRGPVRELLYQLKFNGRKRVSLILADQIAALLNDRFPGLPVIPVPARRSRIRQRGWDPVQLIVSHLSRRHGVEVCRCLKRRGDLSQKTLNFAERKRNISESGIALRHGVHTMIATKEIVLVDDVFTTGATVNECARILLEGGASEVHVLTFAQD